MLAKTIRQKIEKDASPADLASDSAVLDYYRRHLDQFKKDDHRKLSVICYLNEGWKEEHGGQLRIYRTDGPLDILPVAGRLVCFRSDQLEHEVLPATRERLSLTGWILDQYADVKHL